MDLKKQMAAVLARWDESGSSLRSFAEREGHSYAKLIYWRGKLRGSATPRSRTKSKTSEAALTLAPVRVLPDAPSRETPPFGVRLANGVAIEVPTGFDEHELGRLARALSGC